MVPKEETIFAVKCQKEAQQLKFAQFKLKAVGSRFYFHVPVEEEGDFCMTCAALKIVDYSRVEPVSKLLT